MAAAEQRHSKDGEASHALPTLFEDTRVSIAWSDGQQQVLNVDSPRTTLPPKRLSLAVVATAATAAVKQITALQVETWLVPDVRTRHTPLASPLLTLVLWSVYCYMAGRYPTYPHHTTSDTPEATSGWGPASLVPWLLFWGDGLPVFDVGYLYAWGARWAPALRTGQGWRLLTSVLLHTGPAHLVTNTLLWLLLAVSLERTYGALRVTAIFILSAVGGTFMSLVAEDACTVYLGASGGIFGFLGLYLADIALNYQTLVLPLMRLVLLVLGVVAQVTLEYVGPKPPGATRVTSHLSHLGGFFTGAAVSFLFLPHLQDRRWRKVLQLTQRLGIQLDPRPVTPAASPAAEMEGQLAGQAPAGRAAGGSSHAARLSCWSRRRGLYWAACGCCALTVLVFLVAMPAYAYSIRLKRLTCPAMLGV